MFFPQNGAMRQLPVGISKILTEEMKFLTEKSKLPTEKMKFLTEESKILSEETKFLTEKSQDQPPKLCRDILLRLDDMSLCFPPEV
jgi:hypothetical protein